MTQTTTANGSTDTTDTTGKRTRHAIDAVGAITRIGKILDQLSATDRKRVLAFINESNG